MKNGTAKTILSQYGYQISLNSISDMKLKQIISDLTVIPYKLDATKEEEEASKYKVYKYSKSKKSIIVPRYYGIQKFGLPQKVQFEPEIAIMPFLKELRPNQQEVMIKCIAYIEKFGGGLLSVPCGFGKCLAKGTKILMYDGSIKNVEDIIVGDQIMGDDSTARKVLSLARGYERMAEIEDIITGESYTVNLSHILSLKYVGDKPENINKKTYNKGEILDIEVRDYIKKLLDGSENLENFRGYRAKIEFNNDDIKNDLNKINFYDYGKKLNLEKDKIDPSYLVSTNKIRFDILKGILSNYRDDYISGEYEIIIKKTYINNLIISQIKFLTRSLGYFCQTIDEDIAIIIKIEISENDESNQTYPIELKLKYKDEYFGFEIDGNRRFVLGDLTVTHNTVCALYMAHYFKLKTLVVVHKTFLLKQWIRNAKEFMGLTDDQIGIIRQKECKVENKLLVIGMIQTIAKKDYKDVFNRFGFVIYDEAHHIAAKSFSKAPAKIGGSKTLALTATPYRGDQLIKVMYWFTGGTIYQEKAKMNKNVVVKLIHYKSTYQKLFATKSRWFNGKVRADTNKMTTNISLIDSKNRAIVKMIDYIRVNEPERKILILSYRLKHLIELKKGVDELIQKDIDADLIDEDEIKSCFYVSKTKDKDKQLAEESGDIIFATYQMAEEGLDIKHLNTVILAGPKKNIIQSIGRIMRTILKAGDVRPMIIDIADDLEAFNKWRDIRNSIYIKCKYEVEDYYLKDDKFITSPEYYNLYKTDIEKKNRHHPDDFINKHIEQLKKDNLELDNAKSILRDLYENRFDSLKEYNRNKDDPFKLESTELKDILFVEKLTESDFDKIIVKNVDNESKLDLDRDIKLGIDEDDLEFNMVHQEIKAVNLNTAIITKRLF
jgi:superfamily II DNA or RNA helicase